MSCDGPFLYGVKANPYCGCQCDTKCCPPPCCSSVIIKYEIGSDYSAEFLEGCDCVLDAPVGMYIGGSTSDNWETRLQDKKLIPFPKFNKEIVRKKSSDGFVFALGSSCSIPCEVVDVTLTTTGCCLEVLGGGTPTTNYPANTGIRTVGDGTVSATYGAAGDCTFTLNINGSGSSVYLTDGTSVSVTLTMNGPNAICCNYCQVEVICSPLNFVSAAIFYRAKSIEKTVQGYLNVKNLSERVKRLRRNKP